MNTNSCEVCDQTHRVAWYELKGKERLFCDKCLSDYNTSMNTKKLKKRKKIKVSS